MEVSNKQIWDSEEYIFLPLITELLSIKVTELAFKGQGPHCSTFFMLLANLMKTPKPTTSDFLNFSVAPGLLFPTQHRETCHTGQLSGSVICL